MLLYTSLFVAILTATLCARFFFTAISNKDRPIRNSNKQRAKADSTGRYQKEETDFRFDNSFRVPSVPEGGYESTNVRKKHPVNPVVDHNLKSARDIYEERLLSMNKSYKARRRKESGHLKLELVCKPFTRKAAPWAKDNRTSARPYEAQDCPVPIAEPTYSELIQAKSNNMQ